MSLYATAKSWSSRRVLRRAAVVAVVAMALGHSATARGHQASITHSNALISHDQTEVTYRIKFEPADLSEALGLGADVRPTDPQVAAGRDRLLDYVLERVAVRDRDRTCPLEPMGVEVVRQGGRFIEVSWRVRCPDPLTALVIEYDLFFDLDALHRGLLQVQYRGERAVAELKDGQARFVWDLDEPPPAHGAAFVVSGVEHILFGFDHIAFLLGLLLIAVFARAPLSATTWRVRALGPSLRYTAGIVTSFTIAHSLTLVAASLGWITLSSRLVESVIAASIVYVAVENVVHPDPRRRYLVTFGFGLIHGLGFASMLEVLLPPGDVIAPLLLFNVGVELGQLGIVIAVLPLLHMAARVLGAARYRAWFVPLCSGVLAILGLLWLIERVFDVVVLGF